MGVNQGDITENASCFDSDSSLLKMTNGETRFSIQNWFPTRPGESGNWYEVNLQIPSDIECDHCVLQWHYHTANTWGSDENGTGTGHGYQEEFYGCADVEIINTGAPIPSTENPTTKSSTTTTTTTSLPTVPTSTTKPTPGPTIPSDAENPCANGATGPFPHEICSKFYECYDGKAIVKD